MVATVNNANTIRFVLDGEQHVVSDVSPTTTVLQYLRENLKRTGTKEGCAEGDCGACTVVVAELDEHGNGIRYRPVNSCIQFLPTLDGMVLFTVETLKKISGGPSDDSGDDPGEQLHPVQRAMVECHGSQCGFCTPGFVMSMFALYMSNKSASDSDICYALSGNLCRCTGYRPILAAAKAMYEFDDPAPDSFVADLKAMLNDIRVESDKELVTENCRYRAPVSIDGLAKALSDTPDATILAGGTDVGLWVTKQYKKLSEIIYIGNVSALNQVSTSDDAIEIGAAVCLSDAWDVLLAEYPDFEEIVRRFASPPICNSGTLCGNVANGSPIGDTMPGLIVLGAEVCLQHGDATRVLPMEDFYLGYMRNDLQPGEFLRSVRIPKANSNTEFRFYKISKRYDQDISAICAAFALEMDDEKIANARVCFGGMAAVPKRATACEQALIGSAWTTESVETAIEALLADFEPIDDMRASAEYRKWVAGNLLLRFFADTHPSADSKTDRAVSVWQYAEQHA